MSDFMKRVRNSCNKIQGIYDNLLSRDDLDMIEQAPRPHPLEWRFRVHYKGSPYSLSISVPVDVSGCFCETALILSGRLNDNWGYQDVMHFYTLDELCDEIKRVWRRIVSQPNSGA